MDPEKTPPKVGSTEPDYSNAFHYKELYPDPAGLIAFIPAKLDQSHQTGIVALDTNALLFPYGTSKENLESILKVYAKLKKEKRLFVPAQAVREFARNRPDQIQRVLQRLKDRHLPTQEIDYYPLFSSDSSYQRVLELEKELNAKYEELRQKHEEAMKSLRNAAKDWYWNDPVSTAYAQLFENKMIVDSAVSFDDLTQDALRRKAKQIPPGYKDSGNIMNPAGDLIIWNTLLELGKREKKDMILVAYDSKADWRINLPTGSVTRFELVDEYRRASEGHTFHIISLSELLELFETDEKVVQQVKLQEKEQEKLPPIGLSGVRGFYSIDSPNAPGYFMGSYPPVAYSWARNQQISERIVKEQLGSNRGVMRVRSTLGFPEWEVVTDDFMTNGVEIIFIQNGTIPELVLNAGLPTLDARFQRLYLFVISPFKSFIDHLRLHGIPRIYDPRVRVSLGYINEEGQLDFVRDDWDKDYPIRYQ